MVDYHYDENIHRNLRKRRRFKVAVWALAGTLVVAVLLIIWDGLRSDTTVTNQTPPQTRGATFEQAVFDEEHFKLTADSTWQKIESREQTPYHYQSYEDGLAKRDLRIYVNNLPSEFPVTLVLPIEIDGSKVIPLTVSPRCSALVKDKKSRRDQTTQWAGVSFLCDPDSPQYIIGTSHNEDGYLAKINDNKFFFVYRDLEVEPQLATFSNLLRNFEAK
jgi:hypothetical protein